MTRLLSLPMSAWRIARTFYRACLFLQLISWWSICLLVFPSSNSLNCKNVPLMIQSFSLHILMSFWYFLCIAHCMFAHRFLLRLPCPAGNTVTSQFEIIIKFHLHGESCWGHVLLVLLHVSIVNMLLNVCHHPLQS